MKRLLAACALALALAPVAGARGTGVAEASAQHRAATGAPSGLHAFLFRADEPLSHSYPRTPAFAWAPVSRATGYEFELATSRVFADATTIFSDAKLTAPAVSPPLQLPWMTGSPYALWVHVRAIVGGKTTAWSEPFGFNMRWDELPQQQTAPTGLIRWSPVGGATGYDVWYTDIGHRFSTSTNVADEREYWTFHPALARTIRWRVRAVRHLDGPELPNSLARVSYGPYSPVFTTTNPSALTTGALAGRSAISDVDSTATTPKPHELTPGFAWTGTDGITGYRGELWRVYVSTDQQCVNTVMTGSIVGGPAWAPRSTAPLALPSTAKKLADAHAGEVLKSGAEGKTFMADVSPVTASEGGGTTTNSTGSSTSAGTTVTTGTAGQIDLWDIGWPNGRYWWTLVPVKAEIVVSNDADAAVASPDTGALEYHETELPEDACAAGRVWSFGKVSAPVTTISSSPFASGLVTATRVASAATTRPRFLHLPLVAWKPAVGATKYQVELSRKLYPWVAARKQETYATSIVLDLSKKDLGTWYYRVRGVNPGLPKNAQTMTWSKPVELRITGDQFVVVK